MLRAMEEKMTLKKMHLFLAAELLLISLYAVMIPERPVQAAQKKTIFIMGDSKSRYYSDEEKAGKVQLQSFQKNTAVIVALSATDFRI